MNWNLNRWAAATETGRFLVLDVQLLGMMEAEDELAEEDVAGEEIVGEWMPEESF